MRAKKWNKVKNKNTQLYFHNLTDEFYTSRIYHADPALIYTCAAGHAFNNLLSPSRNRLAIGSLGAI